MVRGRKKKYALMWWKNCGSKDVIDWSAIPGKRELGSTVNLLWKSENQKAMRLPAKILAISTDKNELENTVVDSNGEIHDPMKKIFTASILQERKNKAEEIKVQKNIKKLHKDDMSRQILQDKPIFIGNTRPRLPSATVTSGAYSASDSANILDLTRYGPSRNTQVTGSKQLDHTCVTSDLPSPPTRQFKGMSDALENHQDVRAEYCLFDGMIPVSNSAQTLTGHTYQSVTPTNIVSECSQNVGSSTRVLLDVSNANASPPETMQTSLTNVRVDDRTSSDINDSENSNCDEESDKENEDGAVRSLAGMISWKVTKQDILHQELLLKAMKYSFESNQKNDLNSMETFQIDPVHSQPAEHMEQISPGCKFYLSKAQITIISLAVNQAETEDDRWKILVREVLVEVYGSSLSNYSAKGLRGERPSIDTRLFKGLYEWAKRVSPTVNRKNFIMHINKTAYNKRKARNYKKNRQDKRQKTK